MHTSNNKLNSVSNSIQHNPLSRDILGLRVTMKPLKYRWQLLAGTFAIRFRDFCKIASGLTDAEFKDPAYASFIAMHENSFFSLSYRPDNEPSGLDNLVEILTACTNEEIDWNKFIYDKLKDKPEDEQLSIYSEIRKVGLLFCRDLFIEVARIRAA